jgi:hypothetical protein
MIRCEPWIMSNLASPFRVVLVVYRGLVFFGVNTLAAPNLAISRTMEELVSGAPGQSVSTARFSILKSSALIRTLTCVSRLPTISIFYD